MVVMSFIDKDPKLRMYIPILDELVQGKRQILQIHHVFLDYASQSLVT